ncbi:MAG: TonB-dependent receptor domain-containing protein, partial [Longimicrobiales bacterium]
ALYGTAAANGVIVITTKKGIAGTTRFNAYTEYGTIQDVTDYPANYLGYCSIDTSTGGRATFDYCDLGTLADPGLASLNVQLDSVVSFNPLEDPRSTPFEDGARRKFGISASGGTDRATYFLSADIDDEDGLYKFGLSKIERKGVRANIRAQLLDDLDVTVNTGYVRSDATLPQNDNNALGVVPGALLSSAVRFDSVTAGYGFGITPEQISLIDTEQIIDRLTGSVTAEWRPINWLSLIGTAGLDRVNATDQETVPPGQVPFSPTLLEGSRFQERGITTEYTVNFGGNATYEVANALSATTSAGVQYNEQLLRASSAFGALLLPGVPSLEGANARFAVSETNFQVRTIGGYVQQKLDWRNRLFLAAALRADDNSAFGNDFGLAYYPSASVSWVVADEPFFPDIEALSTLRLRAAAGRSGLQPGVLDAFRFFNPVAVSTLQGSTPGFTIGGAGNPNLKPEKITEYELGFDAGLIDDRIGVEFTYFHKTSEDALISRTLPPSLGISATRRENLGSVETSGIE